MLTCYLTHGDTKHESPLPCCPVSGLLIHDGASTTFLYWVSQCTRSFSSIRKPVPTQAYTSSILQVHLHSTFHQDGLQSSFKRSCMSKPPQFQSEESLSPLDWTTGHESLASPFSDDSDSDDGESSRKSETDEETSRTRILR